MNEFNFVYVLHCAVSKISSWRHGLKKNRNKDRHLRIVNGAAMVLWEEIDSPRQ